MRIQVVFLHDVLPRYRAGDVRAVAGGYARNYLIPKGLAAPATAEHLNRIEKIKAGADVQRIKETQDMQALGGLLEGVTVTLRARSGEGGRLYGSVTNFHIAEELARVTGREIDRRLIHLPESIKEVGTFEVPVRLHLDVAPTITVVVEDERRPAAVAEAPLQETAASEESEPAAAVEAEAEADIQAEEQVEAVTDTEAQVEVEAETQSPTDEEVASPEAVEATLDSEESAPEPEVETTVASVEEPETPEDSEETSNAEGEEKDVRGADPAS